MINKMPGVWRFLIVMARLLWRRGNLLLFSFLLATLVFANGHLRLFNRVVGSAGGTLMKDSNYSMASSVGVSPGTKPMSNQTYTLQGGPLQSFIPKAARDLSSAHPFPVPFKPQEGHTVITFKSLTDQATIRIYTLSGELVKTLAKDNLFSDSVVWDVKNDFGEDVFSGVYLYMVDNGLEKKKGKLMIIR